MAKTQTGSNIIGILFTIGALLMLSGVAIGFAAAQAHGTAPVDCR